MTTEQFLNSLRFIDNEIQALNLERSRISDRRQSILDLAESWGGLSGVCVQSSPGSKTESLGIRLALVDDDLATQRAKQYAEKIMIVEEMQETPFHFHRHKMEDIINRGGGVLKIELYASTPDEGLSDDDFEVSIDGIKRQVKGGDVVTLKTGESICLEPFVYHRFWSEEGTTLVGEVSLVNDDNTDNRFYEEVGRFPAIVEDEAPLHLLVSDYT